MLLPLKWLRDYIDINMSAEEFADVMTMSGTKAESVVAIGEEIKNVVVGKVLDISKHPDADKLVVVQVSIGEEERQIVTGADNLKKGDYIPVALHNAKLPGGKKIKRGTMRGVMSDGMLCSGSELGIDNKFIPEHMREGIYVLTEPAELGRDIREVMLLNDSVIEFELTANRPDCNSIIGIALEAGATIKKEVRLPSVSLKEEGDPISVEAQIEEKGFCNRYLLREIQNVRICESPYYIQRRLIESNIRPINNIVDLTNYVMLEYGQPLHAFDYDKLNGKKITVAAAKEGETCVTLDGEERGLDPTMVTIRDNEKVIALGGIMGCANSEVDGNTNRILLESANFDPDVIRFASKKLGLRTEASARFEKGINTQRAKQALDRICYLIEEFGYGTVCRRSVEQETNRTQEKTVVFSPQKINEMMGTELLKQEMVEILQRLHFSVEEKEGSIAATAPLYRTDIEHTADIVEEIARIYGFNNVESAPIVGEIVPASKSEQRMFEDRIKQAAYMSGLTEVLTYSFVSPSGAKKAKLSEAYQDPVRLLNPLGEETSVMRTSLIPNMLDIVSSNLAHKNEFFSGFEFGNVFYDPQDPKQKPSMTAACYGKEEDFFRLKAKMEGIFEILGFAKRQYLPERENELFHPGKSANILIDGICVGVIGEVHPSVAQEFHLKKKVYLAELNIPELNNLYSGEIKAKHIAKYPAMKRDLALVVDRDLYVQEIEDIIVENGKKLIEKVELFDVYFGNQVQEDKKSVAYSITYRRADSTLTDEEVNKVQEKILEELKVKLNAVLRD